MRRSRWNASISWKTLGKPPGGSSNSTRYGKSRSFARPAISRLRRVISPNSPPRSEEHTSELQSLTNLVCRLLLEKKKNNVMHTSIDSARHSVLHNTRGVVSHCAIPHPHPSPLLPATLTTSTYTPHPFFFFFNDTATTEIYTLSLHDALPISEVRIRRDTGSPVRSQGRRSRACDESSRPILLRFSCHRGASGFFILSQSGERPER